MPYKCKFDPNKTCDGCGECEELRDWDKPEYCIKVANGDGYFDNEGNYIGTCANNEDY